MKELTIISPEGYEIDKEKSTFEKIVFKPIDNKPRSWEEYCKSHQQSGFYIEGDSKIHETNSLILMCKNKDKNLLPSKELAEAFLAMMQLMSLRQAWVGDWKPYWKIANKEITAIIYECDRIVCQFCFNTSHPLSFPTSKMAQEFLDCFKDLIEQAKILL